LIICISRLDRGNGKGLVHKLSEMKTQAEAVRFREAALLALAPKPVLASGGNLRNRK
jgi:hypothetical protein